MRLNFGFDGLRGFAPRFFSCALPFLVLSLMSLTLVDDVAIAFLACLVGVLQLRFRPLAVLFLVGPFIAGVSIINAVKIRYAGEALTWQDIQYALPNLGENLGTLIQYLDFKYAFWAFLFVVLMVLAIRLERAYLVHTRSLAYVFLSLVFVFYVPCLFGGVAAAANYIENQKVVNGWTFSNSGRQSALGRFVQSALLKQSDFLYAQVGPAKFDDYRVDQIPISETAGQRPDVIIVLQESQFDPSQIKECQSRNDCALTMFQSGPHTKQTGPLHVHIFGGGTWNSEMALMTGTPHTWYSGGDYKTYTVTPRIRKALGHHMNDLGYRTVVVYPVQKGMINAMNAYRAYGMNEFYGAEALGLSADWCEVSDRVMYQKLADVRKRLIREDGRPLFMVMLTIFNHGPYGERCAKKEHTISAMDPAEIKLKKKLADFLQRSRESDRESTAFVRDVLAEDRKALILVAGDHQPSFEGMAMMLPRKPHRPMPDNEALYFTGYHFHSNFRKSAPSLEKELDVMFLPSTLLELAGLPMDAMFSANRKLRDACGGRLDQCPGDGFIDSYRHRLMLTGFFE